MLLVLVVGNIIGTGVYTLFGSMVARAGGAVWATFVLAFFLALFTAYSYAELVTKYPDAAGAPLYASKAFKRPFWAFMVAFGVASSGITSASTAARQFGTLSPVAPTQEALSGGTLAALNGGKGLSVVAGALLFIVVLGLVNFRGIKESTKVNVALTVIEVGGLLLIVGLGMVAVLRGAFDPARLLDLPQGSSVPLALLGGTALAFFALVGFEDTVNLAEETKNPSKAFPRALRWGLALTCIVYPRGQRTRRRGREDRPTRPCGHRALAGGSTGGRCPYPAAALLRYRPHCRHGHCAYQPHHGFTAALRDGQPADGPRSLRPGSPHAANARGRDRIRVHACDRAHPFWQSR
jgi:amino acid transporter